MWASWAWAIPGGDVSNAATGSNIGHRAVGSDPLQVGTIRNTADRQRPAVDEQVERVTVSWQPSVPMVPCGLGVSTMWASWAMVPASAVPFPLKSR